MTTLVVVIDYDPDTKTYGATSPDLPKVYAVSDSRDDVLHRFIRSTQAHVAFLRERGETPAVSSAHQEVVTIAIEAA